MPYFGSSWNEDWYPNDKKMENISQYFMYGISIPYKDYKDWNLDSNDNISCVFDTRDGKYMIVGKILEKTDDNNQLIAHKGPIIVPELSKIDKLIIKNSIKNEFGLEGEFHYYFITQYK